MKLPDIRFKLPDLPRKVTASLAVLAGAGVTFLLLLQFLVGALDAAVAENTRLKGAIDQATRDTLTVNTDYQFVTENTEYFEKLIKGDRLIPHTRRDALRQLQSLAQEHGLTQMTADFSAAPAATAATAPAANQADAYRVNVESIKIKLGSPLDGQVYGFASDLRRNFPGSAVLMSMKLSRPLKLTADMIEQVSRKGAIVTGEMELLWRTALANEKKP